MDFSKAVVITDKSYIDAKAKPYIRLNEHKALLGKEYLVVRGLIRYIKNYKIAKTKLGADEKKRLVQYSALQHFEEYIFEQNKKLSPPWLAGRGTLKITG